MSLADIDYGKIILIIYLCVFAYQDIRWKQIDLRICCLFYIMIALLYGVLWVEGHSLDYFGIALGIAPAMMIFLLSRITRSGIGTGDGFFFLGLGFGMGIAAVSEVILYSILIMGMVSLVLVVFFLFSDQSGRGKSIPMIPFVLVPGIWVILR